MNEAVPLKSAQSAESLQLPQHRDAFYGGKWHKAKSGRSADAINPGTGESLGPVADCGAADIDAAVEAAKTAFDGWRNTPPLERARLLEAHRQCAARARRGTGDDRRCRLRQSGPRKWSGCDHRRGANRILRRSRHRDERRLDPDGTGRGEFLRARAARRGRPHHSVQPSVHVLRRQIRRAARRPATPW